MQPLPTSSELPGRPSSGMQRGFDSPHRRLLGPPSKPRSPSARNGASPTIETKANVRPTAWTALSVIHAAAELIAKNGPAPRPTGLADTRPKASLTCGYAPPDAALAAKLDEAGVQWAWQMSRIEPEQWELLGASIRMQCAIKDVLAGGRKAEAMEPVHFDLGSTPSTAEVLSLASFSSTSGSRPPGSGIDPWFLPPGSRFKRSPETRRLGENDESTCGSPSRTDTHKQPTRPFLCATDTVLLLTDCVCRHKKESEACVKRTNTRRHSWIRPTC